MSRKPRHERESTKPIYEAIQVLAASIFKKDEYVDLIIEDHITLDDLCEKLIIDLFKANFTFSSWHKFPNIQNAYMKFHQYVQQNL